MELPTPRFVTAVRAISAQSEQAFTQKEMNSEHRIPERMSPLISLSNLPPLLLEILLPPSYPLYDPPQIVSLHAMHSWLPLSRLHRIFMEMWEPGEGVLYAWIECVRSGDSLGMLGLTFSTQGDEYIRCAIFPAIIPQLILLAM